VSAAESPTDPRASPWLAIAAPVGKVAAYFLIAANFLLLFAPLVLLLDLASQVEPGGSGSSLVALFADPMRLIAIADLVAIVGVVILVLALFLVLFGLVRGDRRVPLAAYALGIGALACLVAWIPVMAYSLGRARGGAGGDAVAALDAAAATGGWSLAAVLLLAASLLYVFFCLRMEGGTGLRLRTLKWPVYAAVNLLGSVAIAGFFEGAAGGSGSVDAFTLGLVLKVTLIPVLGGMAYQEMRDRFPLWARLLVQNAPVAVRPTPPEAEFARPLPPPPND
jgi:hypothetical protein